MKGFWKPRHLLIVRVHKLLLASTHLGSSGEKVACAEAPETNREKTMKTCSPEQKHLMSHPCPCPGRIWIWQLSGKDHVTGTEPCNGGMETPEVVCQGGGWGNQQPNLPSPNSSTACCHLLLAELNQRQKKGYRQLLMQS
uniref:Uncharacterized protein n=1 Tax=Molossus molossus TaxID=27622 RepID=A0A7J8GRT0_MOLMO|nr:hypothetical protein HJG59_011350 [Molossus molossus]